MAGAVTHPNPLHPGPPLAADFDTQPVPFAPTQNPAEVATPRTAARGAKKMPAARASPTPPLGSGTGTPWGRPCPGGLPGGGQGCAGGTQPARAPAPCPARRTLPPKSRRPAHGQQTPGPGGEFGPRVKGEGRAIWRGFSRVRHLSAQLISSLTINAARPQPAPQPGPSRGAGRRACAGPTRCAALRAGSGGLRAARPRAQPALRRVPGAAECGVPGGPRGCTVWGYPRVAGAVQLGDTRGSQGLRKVGVSWGCRGCTEQGYPGVAGAAQCGGTPGMPPGHTAPALVPRTSWGAAAARCWR